MQRRSATEETERVGHLYAEEGERLWRAVFAFAGDREVASDAVAEAFAQCLRRGGAVRDPRRWVWRAAFRIAAGELKERGRWARWPTDAVVYDADPPGGLFPALRSLPPMQRATLVLRHYAGYDAGEIAQALGIGRATVRVHLSRGRRRLRTLLEEDDA
ncbi:MAG: sigma-70 family RNA polymerase sigma factor [Actinomycetota bacterium]|nr:sigma-70 family RNA polymerase sigma factor [Actinomycetota bacterium]